MRTGAIFARGSCRALQWMAVFGVVFALGAGSAVAQVTVEAPETVDEGGRATLTVTAKVDVAAAHNAASTITVTTTAAAGTAIAPDTAAETTGAGVDLNDPADLVFNVAVNDGDESVERTYTGTITVQTLPDLDAENEVVSLTFAVEASDETNVTNAGGVALALDADSSPADITIDDTDTQTFELDLTTSEPQEGASIVVELKAVPAPVDLSHPTTLIVDAAGYTVAPTAATLSSAADSATITITPPATDGDRDEDAITLSALVAGTTEDRADPLVIDVEDIHTLPAGDKITAKAYMDDDGDKSEDEAMSVMEGGAPVHVTVTVDRGTSGYPAGEALDVAVMADASQGMDFRAEPVKLSIGAGTGEQTADFMLWALADQDVGAEDLMLNLVATGATAANGPGESMGMFSIMIEDATAPMVQVKDDAQEQLMTAMGDDPLNPGDSFSLMASDLFMFDMDAVSVSYGVSVAGGAVSASVSGDAVMVMAEEAGEAEVTITATATSMMSSFVVTQTTSNVAQIAFPVMVELADLMVTLTGPEDMNLAEGMSAMITATANRPVVGDTMVELIPSPDDTAAPADYMVDPLMIMDGMMEGTTMLTAVDDNMMEDMEMLTLEGRVGEMKTNTVMFYLWDAAVPALPLIAQLLLAAFLAIGGYRRYLRR